MGKTGELCYSPGEVKLEWKIKDFLLLSKKCYQSPEFYFSGEFWEIRIYPDGDAADASEGWIDLFVRRVSSGCPVTVNFSFSLKTVEGGPDIQKSRTRVFHETESGWGFSKVIKRSKLIERKSELLPSDALIVICTLTNSKTSDADGNEDSKKVDRDTQTEKETGNEDSIKVDRDTQTVKESGNDCKKNKVLEDLKELLLKQEDCDVIIRVKEQEFPAHRLILKARSPVLAAAFRNDMKEKSTGILNIEDCDPAIFPDFLCFLYYGEVKNLSTKNVFSLYGVSDKYDVPDLKTKCAELMKEELSVETFCKTISLALVHREAELLKLCTDFFTTHLQKIIVTVQWQSFVAQYPTETNELFIKALVPDKK